MTDGYPVKYSMHGSGSCLVDLEEEQILSSDTCVPSKVDVLVWPMLDLGSNFSTFLEHRMCFMDILDTVLMVCHR